MQYEAEVFNGNAYELPLIYKDSAGDPVDLTGVPVQLKLAPNYTGVSSLTKTPSNVLTNDGRIDFLLSSAEITSLGSVDKDVDIIMNVNVTIAGRLKTILSGMLKIKRALI